jgi:hypothetical protein
MEIIVINNFFLHWPSHSGARGPHNCKSGPIHLKTFTAHNNWIKKLTTDVIYSVHTFFFIYLFLRMCVCSPRFPAEILSSEPFCGLTNRTNFLVTHNKDL